jgi:aryl-alcohol dehydrogenase-like predicted oxidoreductase
MILRKFGRHDLDVSALGLGAGPLGDVRVDESDVARLIHGALELGVTLFDTAPSYGASEERLGRYLAESRKRVVLSTKLGYGVPGIPDWTGPCISAGIDAALERLRTDWIDIAHLHSCPADVLAREDILRALEDAVSMGKIRVAAYSGDGEGLRAAKRLPVFGAFQFSHSIVDQEAIHEGLPPAVGTIGKRSLLNAAFANAQASHGRPDVEEYRRRWAALPNELREELEALGTTRSALRFAAHSDGVCACLVGTTRLKNLRDNVEAVAEGPLDAGLVQRIRAWWATNHWPGLV